MNDLIIEQEEYKINRIAGLINIISQSEVENLWQLEKNNHKVKSFFPKNFLKEIKNYIANDYYIIYLSGISIFKQTKIMATKKYQFNISSINEEVIRETGYPGYYLVKIRRKGLAFVTNYKEIMPCPKNWRRANPREACEIMFNILLIDQKKIYKKEWHIYYNIKDENKIFQIGFSLSRLKEIIIKNIPMKIMSDNINSITIRRL